MSLARWALGSGCLDALGTSRTSTQIAAGEVVGPAAALAELGHLDADPARAGPLDSECLAWRGVFSIAAGDLGRAVTDMTAGLQMVRRGAPLTLGLQPYAYLALAQHLAGRWDDALLTCEQAFSAAAIRSRRSELPLLHLAAGRARPGRGGRTARHAGRGGRRQPGLLPRETARGGGPGAGLPGRRRPPGHGRRARAVAR